MGRGILQAGVGARKIQHTMDSADFRVDSERRVCGGGKGDTNVGRDLNSGGSKEAFKGEDGLFFGSEGKKSWWPV